MAPLSKTTSNVGKKYATKTPILLWALFCAGNLGWSEGATLDGPQGGWSERVILDGPRYQVSSQFHASNPSIYNP